MRISVYGAGYVGLVSAVCFAKLGHEVICADINEERILKLKQGILPIYEEQLPELLNEALQSGRIAFTTNLRDAAHHADQHFIATGTPSLADGSADLSQVFDVAAQLASFFRQDALVVIKSTVPVGTGQKIETYLQEELKKYGKTLRILVASNPEFLREGRAVLDFMEPDRIVIGASEAALELLKKVYEPLTKKNIALICMSRESAELTKYAANAFLANKISFINQISRIAEKTGANVDEIQQGIGTDQRIGFQFLKPGVGYGGSCFPKDVRALRQISSHLGMDVALFEAIEAINQSQKCWMIEKLQQHFNYELQNLTIGVWGLAFKPGTDDVREASSLALITALLAAKANLRVYDPKAMSPAKKRFPAETAIYWAESADEIISSSVDALLITTEWSEFCEYPLAKLAERLQDSPLIDGRNCYALSAVEEAGLAHYYSVGRPYMAGSTHAQQ